MHDFRSDEVGHIEHVDDFFTEGRNMCRSDIEIEPPQSGGELVEQTRTIQPRYFDDSVAVGLGIIDDHFGDDMEGLAVFALVLGGDCLCNLDFTFQRLFDAVGNTVGAAQFVLIIIKGARDRDGIECHAIRGRENLCIDDIGPGGGTGSGDDGQQARMVGGGDGQFCHTPEFVGRNFGGQ